MTASSVTVDPLDAVGGPGDIDGHYAALGADPAGSIDELRRHYRALARQWHPDRNPGVDTTARMVRLNDAANVLLDEGARADYDTRSATPPLILFASPSPNVRCSTFVGTPGVRIVEIGASRAITDIDVSKLSGDGWSARAFAGSADDVVLVLEITIDATRTRRVRDDIVVTAANATLWIGIDAAVEPAPTFTSPKTSVPPPRSWSRRTSRMPSPVPTGSKWRTRLTGVAWIAAVLQCFLGSKVISPDYITANLPHWSWSVADFALSSTSMFVLAAVAAVLTRGFTRWRWRTGPIAIVLLVPGIVALAAVSVAAALIALALAIALALFGLFALVS